MQNIGKLLHITVITSYLGMMALVSPQKISAASATLTFSPKTQNVSLGETTTVRIMVNTDGVAVNRVLAKITYPANLVVPQSLNQDDSFVTIWYQTNIGSSDGLLILEGGVSGNGATGSSLKMATINFETIGEGEAQIAFSPESKIFQESDGTNILTNYESGSLVISGLTPSPQISPTATPSLPQNPTVTPTIATSVTPTSGPLPKSGTTDTTLSFLFFGVLMTTGGLILLIKT